MPDASAPPSSTRSRLGRPPGSDGTRTRAALLDAALKLFARQGYAATTVREIAAEVGVTDAAIYAYFPRKRAIFEALFELAGPPLLAQLGFDPEQAAEGAPEDVLPPLFEELVARWDTQQVRLFTSVLMREGGADIAPAVAQASSVLEEVVHVWQARGVLRDDVGADLLAWELVAPLAALRLSRLHAAADDEDRAAARDLARRHVAYFLRSAVTPPGNGR